MKARFSVHLAALFGVALLAQSVFATPAPSKAPVAASIVATAEATAATENKNVLVLFHASWCHWCHKLDDFLARPDIAPMIDANYVAVHIVVMENEDKKDLDNPGGEELLDRLGGKDQGIPYYAILSPTNETLAVSKDTQGNNLGYPTDSNAIPVFVKMIKSTSHRLSDADADLLAKKLDEAGAPIRAQMEQAKTIDAAMRRHDYKSAISLCDKALTSGSDLLDYASYTKFEALLHVDESQALSQFGQPLGNSKSKDADTARARAIVEEDSLTDAAYNKALGILVSNGDKGVNGWSKDLIIAQGYSRIRQFQNAIKYQEKAIRGAKDAKLPQRAIDSFTKAEEDWKARTQ